MNATLSRENEAPVTARLFEEGTLNVVFVPFELPCIVKFDAEIVSSFSSWERSYSPPSRYNTALLAEEEFMLSNAVLSLAASESPFPAEEST